MRLEELGELQNESGRCIHLVVKNSFIELVEEESPREMRRAQSCDAVFAAAESVGSPRATVSGPLMKRTKRKLMKRTGASGSR